MKLFTLVHDNRIVSDLGVYPEDTLHDIKELAVDTLYDILNKDIDRNIEDAHITIFSDETTEIIMDDDDTLEQIWNELTDPYISLKYIEYTREQLFLIALQIRGYYNIMAFCETHKKAQKYVCDNGDFWMTRLRRDHDFYETIDRQNARYYHKFFQDTDFEKLYKKLQIATEYGYLPIVKYLVKQGADPKDDYPLYLAVENGHLDIIEYLVGEGADIHQEDDALLATASMFGHLPVVQYLIEKGLDIHRNDDISLRVASREGHLDIVKYLVEEGANVNALNDDSLYKAMVNDKLEVAKYLFKHGAEIDFDNNFYYIGLRAGSPEKLLYVMGR